MEIPNTTSIVRKKYRRNGTIEKDKKLSCIKRIIEQNNSAEFSCMNSETKIEENLSKMNQKILFSESTQSIEKRIFYPSSKKIFFSLNTLSDLEKYSENNPMIEFTQLGSNKFFVSKSHHQFSAQSPKVSYKLIKNKQNYLLCDKKEENFENSDNKDESCNRLMSLSRNSTPHKYTDYA